jgi:dTDP-3-amino-2,3,6-trideoxy-4-keto-D-glucose/dTDP-3-amino-3,4,6-trideoxy-alpha-D-glucose/dTDP-2,6-dideoxy-D-kanosamine transaminase
MKNFVLKQYAKDKKFKIKHNYLSEQFKNSKQIINKILDVVNYNDFTLGRYVDILEDKFAKLLKVRYAIGVGSGTDAIFLSLKAMGIKEGDEVITPTFSFYATSGAIATTGAKPVFVDINEDLNIDTSLIEKAITSKTKAIVPVHWSGRICDMKAIKKIAKKYSLFIVEDACHAIIAHDDKKQFAGTFGDVGCFSFHPLKNLNVWGDGGIITTNSSKLNRKLRLLRNHGLQSRDNCEIYGYNSRLDTIQAAVALEMLKKINHITQSRIKNANFLNKHLSKISEIKIIVEPESYKSVFHLYQFYSSKRDSLNRYLHKYGIDSKIHYPIPLHMHKSAKIFNYKKGDFKNAEQLTKNIISLPIHEFITNKQLVFMVNCIKRFHNES